MSAPEIKSPTDSPQEWEFFAFIIDEEVAVVMPMHKSNMPAHVAALSSDPKVVIVPDELKNIVKSGWKYSQESFIQ